MKTFKRPTKKVVYFYFSNQSNQVVLYRRNFGETQFERFAAFPTMDDAREFAFKFCDLNNYTFEESHK